MENPSVITGRRNWFDHVRAAYPPRRPPDRPDPTPSDEDAPRFKLPNAGGFVWAERILAESKVDTKSVLEVGNMSVKDAIKQGKSGGAPAAMGSHLDLVMSPTLQLVIQSALISAWSHLVRRIQRHAKNWPVSKAPDYNMLDVLDVLDAAQAKVAT